jgi:cytochrome c556
VALAVATPAALHAAPALRPIMHQWRGEARIIQATFQHGGAAEDAQLRGALSLYVADAGRISAAVDGKTARARDFKQRFLAFQADAQAALGHLAQTPSLKADVARLMADCHSCHRAFNN